MIEKNKDYKKVKLILSKNKFLIRIETESEEYIKKMRELFSEKVKGYFWMAKYKSGGWNGTTCMISETNRTFPFGLLLEYIKLHKKYFKDYDLKADNEVKEIYKSPKIPIKYDLSLQPRPYQKEAIEICLKSSKGIIRSATASGKSLIISYIIKNILKNRNITKVRRNIIVVPSIQLVEQFYNDMIEYGINEKYIGRVHAKSHQWDLPIVISTWQTLMNNHDKLNMYDCCIIDETHTAKSHELKKIMKKSIANYRFGFTGTMHNNRLDNLNTMAFIGPILKDFPSGFLAEKGYISKCNVKILKLRYSELFEGSYNQIKNDVFYNKGRLNIIKDIVKESNHNILLLVGYKKEGYHLEKMLKYYTDRDIIFLSGKDKVEIREEWRKKMMKKKNIALIATYGIFQAGINIPNLKYCIFASPFKSKIRVLQSIGRTLRKHKNKKEGSYIYDLQDQVKYLIKHGRIRHSFYEEEKFNIDEIKYNLL